MGLFVDPSGERTLTELWNAVAGEPRQFASYAESAKLAEAVTTFAPEIEWLDRELDGAAGPIDLPLALASLPVYRTYVEPATGRVTRTETVRSSAAPASRSRSHGSSCSRSAATTRS